MDLVCVVFYDNSFIDNNFRNKVGHIDKTQLNEMSKMFKSDNPIT